MIDELLVAGLVRAWSEQVAPSERAAADGGAAVAVRCFAGGASMSEAVSEGRRFVESWARHPSHQQTPRAEVLSLAS
jgi:hypothetical protein